MQILEAPALSLYKSTFLFWISYSTWNLPYFFKSHLRISDLESRIEILERQLKNSEAVIRSHQARQALSIKPKKLGNKKYHKLFVLDAFLNNFKQSK